MASEKRCLYEVLGLQRDCSPDEIRSAYKKMALQRHPDKLVQSGLSQAEATAQFQELVHAYEVLSDPKERTWYDSHRNQILFSDLNSTSNSVPNSVVPNLYSYFNNTAFSGYSDSGKGFYKVYSDLFDKINLNEINYVKKLGLRLDLVKQAPIMGNLESPYTQVTAFYNYWLGFGTVMEFFWVDQYDAMAGINRKSRRVMEEENKKLRKKAKREYNETVRGLAEFVKKRDKRVIDMMVKREEEREKKRQEERARKKKLELEKMERASRYQEPEWARVDAEEGNSDNGIEEELDEKRNEFYCVVCGKKFKSEKQWKNHEQSKKHKEKVAELREHFAEEDEEMENFQELDDEVEELGERFKEGLGVEEREVENGDGKLSGNDDEEYEVFDAEEAGVGEEIGDEDEELSVLEAMVSGRKSRKVSFRENDEVLKTEDHVKNEDHVQNESEEGEPMEYENRKSTRRKKKKDRGRKNAGVGDEVGDEDEEMSVLEAMVSGRKGRKVSFRQDDDDVLKTGDHFKNKSDESEPMEYNNRKSTRRKNKKDKGRKNGGEDTKGDNVELNGHNSSHTEEESSSHAFTKDESNGIKDDQSSSHAFTKDESNGIKDDQSRNSFKTLNQEVDGKGSTKDRNTKKNSSKGKKAKATSKNPSNLCEKCGEEFESRNKLYKHLGDTGHASLKFQ